MRLPHRTKHGIDDDEELPTEQHAEAAELFERLRFKACQIVEDNMKTIKRVAARLIEDGTLGGDAIDRIIENGS